MNRKSALILIVVLVVLGIVSFLLSRHKSASWQPASRNSTGKLLEEFDPNAVAAIHIKSDEGEVTLVRKDGTWVVEQRENYPADFDRISNLIRKFWQLHALQNVEAGPSQLGRLHLTEPGDGEGPHATRLEFKDAENKSLSVLLLGKTYSRTSPGADPNLGGFAMGRYVMVLKDPPQPVLIKDTLTDVVVRPEEWLDRNFLRLENAKSLTFVNGNTTWTIERSDPDKPWTLAGLEPEKQVNQSKVSAAARAINWMEISDVQPKDTPFEAQQTLTVTTFDHLTYTFQFGKPVDGKYPVRINVVSDAPKTRTPAEDEKPEDKERLDKEFAENLAKIEETVANIKRREDRTFLVDQSSLAPLFVNPSEFIAEPTPAPTPGPTPEE